MAGIVRIVVGALLFLLGIPLLFFFLIGLGPMILGLILIAWGLDARRRAQAEALQQQQMAQQNMLLQQMASGQGAHYAPTPVVINNYPAAQAPVVAPPQVMFRCRYCNTVYPETSGRCPQCGAGF